MGIRKFSRGTTIFFTFFGEGENVCDRGLCIGMFDDSCACIVLSP